MSAAIASWTKPSEITTLNIKKGGTSYPLQGGFVGLSYYESLLSPHLSATLTFIDTGFGVQQGTLRSSLPISGKEPVEITITHPSGILDFDSYYFLVDTVDVAGQDGNKEIINLRLISQYEDKNKTVKVEGAYDNNIRNSLSNILTSKLGVPTNRLSLENTENSLSFKGTNRTPFEIGLYLAPRSRPANNGAPGFVFYETQSGLNFKALNSLISGSEVDSYTSKGVDAGGENQHSNCRIIAHTVIKNQDISAMEEVGVFRNRTSFFNPLTQEVVTDDFNITNWSGAFNTLGTNNLYTEAFDIYGSDLISNDIDIPQSWGIFDPGNNAAAPSFNVGISTACNNIIQSINNDPRLYQALAIMRYNSLFTLVYDIVVPCNTFLKVGQVIKCEFPKITGSNRSGQPHDQWESGKYLILHLSHKFTQNGELGSTTHMRVVRDTRGLT